MSSRQCHNRVAKTCQPCQPVGANFSRPVLIFGLSTQKNCSSTGASMKVALVLEARVLVAPVQPANNTSVASTSATSNEHRCCKLISTAFTLFCREFRNLVKRALLVLIFGDKKLVGANLYAFCNYDTRSHLFGGISVGWQFEQFIFCRV